MVVLIFGASGSAGGGVLQACLAWPAVTEIRAIARRPLAVAHPRLRVVQHQAFDDYSAIPAAFAGIDACFYCLGKSSTQVPGEAEYRRLTYDFALTAARAAWRGSPAAVFQFISGASTRIDSRYMWARVKAETERDLLVDGHTGQLLAAGLDRRGALGERAGPVPGGAPGDAPAEAVPQPVRPRRGHRARDARCHHAGHAGADLRECRDPRPRGRRTERGAGLKGPGRRADDLGCAAGPGPAKIKGLPHLPVR